jgi:hypothetical protein
MIVPLSCHELDTLDTSSHSTNWLRKPANTKVGVKVNESVCWDSNEDLLENVPFTEIDGVTQIEHGR